MIPLVFLGFLFFVLFLVGLLACVKKRNASLLSVLSGLERIIC